MSATKVRCLCGVGGCDIWDGMQHEKFDNDRVPYCINCNYINDTDRPCFNCGCDTVGYLTEEEELGA